MLHGTLPSPVLLGRWLGCHPAPGGALHTGLRASWVAKTQRVPCEASLGSGVRPWGLPRNRPRVYRRRRPEGRCSLPPEIPGRQLGRGLGRRKRSAQVGSGLARDSGEVLQEPY